MVRLITLCLISIGARLGARSEAGAQGRRTRAVTVFGLADDYRNLTPLLSITRSLSDTSQQLNHHLLPTRYLPGIYQHITKWMKSIVESLVP